MKRLLLATAMVWVMFFPRHPMSVGAPAAESVVLVTEHRRVAEPRPEEPVRWSVGVVPGVGPSYLTYEIAQIAEVLYREFDRFGTRAILSGMGQSDSYSQWSYHRAGLAVDVRVWNVWPWDRLLLMQRVCRQLRRIDPQYRVIFGSPDHTDHAHIERRHEGHELPAGGTWCPE